MLLVLNPSPVHAQAAVAEVSGTVTDPSGAAIPGAKINLIETEKGASHPTVTDSSGHYILPELPVGPYRLEASSGGFKTHVQTGIVLQVSDQVTVNVALEVGVTSESVEVHAAAEMVQTNQNSIAQVVDSARMVDLPLNGRQATQLVLISGGSVAATVPSQDVTSGKSNWAGVTISVSGGQQNGTNYLLDGGDNVETAFDINLPFPFPDALQEFSVETSALPARNGTEPGGLVNAVTKSGSNSLHGDFFDFLRNGDVNARNYFAATHDSLKRNQFGGVVGGAIVKDKLFFFGGYQGTRNRTQPPSTISYVPTAAVLNGDFSTFDSAGCESSGKAKTLTNPLTKVAFPNNQIPVSMLDPAAIKLASYLPLAGANACGKVIYGVPTTGDEDQWIGRVDWVKSSKHALFGRYFIADFSNPGADVMQPTPNVLLSNRAGNLERSQNVTIGDTYTFGPTTVNSFRATFTRIRNDRGAASDMIGPETVGINAYALDPHDLYVTNGSDFTVSCNACNHGFFNVNTYDLKDAVDLIHGNHQLAFGVDFIRTQDNMLAYSGSNGQYAFNGSATGDTMADYMIGAMSTFSQNRPQAETLRQTVPAAYVQDTYHATKRLVLNFGLRWEPEFYPVDVFHRGAVFSMANFLSGTRSQVYPNAPPGASFYGDAGVPAGFTKNTPWNFSPRLGLVWDPAGDGKQTLRIGAGIMYDTGEVFFPQRVMADPPYGNSVQETASAPGGFANPWTAGYNYPGGNPFPNPFELNPTKSSTTPIAAQWVLLPDSMKPTRLVQWNASYQRQLGGNWLATVTYMGNKTTHLWTSQEINPGVFIPGTCGSANCSTTTNTASRRVMTLLNPTLGPYYGLMDMSDDGANANYNAVLASLQHRLSHSFTLLANYTWSHCLGDTDFSGDNTGPKFENPNNLRQDYGNCAFDDSQVWNLTIVATSPAKGNGFAGRLLKNWQLAPLIRRVSGIPINILTGADDSLSGVALDRPNLVEPGSVYNSDMGPKLQYLNPAAFSANALGTFGNVGRDAITGPAQFNFDLALSRMFTIRENWHLEARAEAFNAINHTNFAPNLSVGVSSAYVPSGSVSSPSISSSTFGQITAAGDPRIFQFALKLVF
jgi:hypothetical protein